MNIQPYLKCCTAQHAAMVLISQPVVMAVFSPLAGRLSDKIETRVVASIIMGFSAVGLFLFTFIDPDTHFGFIITGKMPSMGSPWYYLGSPSGARALHRNTIRSS